MYSNYKIARDKAWETLLECKINKLPTDLGAIAKHYGCKIVLYSDTNIAHFLKTDIATGDGFVLRVNNQKQIYLNDTIHNKARRRFTLAHELGHVILGHDIGHIHYQNNEIDNPADIQETQANIFARNILMPATVLAALNIYTLDEIMALCDVPYQSAAIRAGRMKELYKKGMFNRHPLERKVRKQFEAYIKTTLAQRSRVEKY